MMLYAIGRCKLYTHLPCKVASSVWKPHCDCSNNLLCSTLGTRRLNLTAALLRSPVMFYLSTLVTHRYRGRHAQNVRNQHASNTGHARRLYSLTTQKPLDAASRFQVEHISVEHVYFGQTNPSVRGSSCSYLTLSFHVPGAPIKVFVMSAGPPCRPRLT